MKTIFVSLLLAISSALFAQTKNEISVGVGPSFFGWGDIFGAAFTASYNYQFSKHIGIEPRLISSNAWRKSDYYLNSGFQGYSFKQTGYFAMAASLVYTPFNGKGSFLKLKSGFLAGKMAHTYGGGDSRPDTKYVDFDKETLFGLIHTVHLRILNKEKFFIGTELSMLTSFSEGYYNCDGFVWNLMGGMKF